MIYVNIQAEKSEGRGHADGNGWHDTDDVTHAIALELQRFERMWNHLGHGAIISYTITAATDANPNRTTTGQPLPVP